MSLPTAHDSSDEQPPRPTKPVPVGFGNAHVRRLVLLQAVARGVAWGSGISVAAMHGPGDGATAPVIGLGFGEISLAATWLALGAGNWQGRLIVTALQVAAGTTAMLIAFHFLLPTIFIPIYVGLGIGIALDFALLQLPFWCARLLFRFHIVDPAVATSSGPWQFSLGQLLGSTTLIAAALALLRGVAGWFTQVNNTGGGGVPDLPRLVLVFTFLVGFWLLLAWPLIVALLSPRLLLLFPFAVITAAGATYWEDTAFQAFIGGGGESYFFWLSNGPHYLLLAASLIALRLSGYRLARTGSPS